MKFRKKCLSFAAVILAVLVLLTGCVTAEGPGNTPVDVDSKLHISDQSESGTDITAPVPEGEKIYADSVDSFLAALGSDRTIVLRDGTYDLTQASDYGLTGTSDYYYWLEIFDGYELAIEQLENLTIVSESGSGDVSIVTQPRYANVLRFERCREITIDGITAGHTPEAGACSGGVLYYNGCEDISVNGSVLYGCGTLGVEAENCKRVFIDNTAIKECSYGAIQSMSCFDVRFTNGKIYSCGTKNDYYRCFDLLYAITTTGFAVHNTEIFANNTDVLLNSSYSAGVEMRGCKVYNNQLGNGFAISGKSPVVDGCSFDDNTVDTTCWYADYEHYTADKNGKALSDIELDNMEYAIFTESYEGPALAEPADMSFTIDKDGRKEYHVKNVDEFLSVIGSDRVIYLDGEHFDLSTATNYGDCDGTYYYWQDDYDGPGLIITGVENMSIVGKGAADTVVEALPRYAIVLSFLGCRGVTLEKLTMGHVREAGSCTGDVIFFQSCDSCEVLSCGLFGCGVNGIHLNMNNMLTVKNTEIYECSEYGAVIEESYNISFENCSIHDCGRSQILVTDYSDVTWDGKTESEASKIFASEWE